MLYLRGGVAISVGAFGRYGGAARGARPGVPPSFGTGPQAARPDGGREEGRGYGGAPRRRLDLHENNSADHRFSGV